MCQQKSIKIPNITFHASPPVGMELFHVDRRTDMTRLIAAIRSLFSKGPKSTVIFIIVGEAISLLVFQYCV
jgi:hypothetical protein